MPLSSLTFSPPSLPRMIVGVPVDLKAAAWKSACAYWSAGNWLYSHQVSIVQLPPPFAVRAEAKLPPIHTVLRVGSWGSTRIIWSYQHCPWQMFMSVMPGTGFVGALVAFTPLATQVRPPSAER